MKEAHVKRKVKALLDSYLHLFWFMPQGTGFGKSGIPDFVICYKGHMIGIETKLDASKKPTALQEYQMERMRKAGAHAMVIHKDNIDELKELLDSL